MDSEWDPQFLRAQFIRVLNFVMRNYSKTHLIEILATHPPEDSYLDRKTLLSLRESGFAESDFVTLTERLDHTSISSYLALNEFLAGSKVILDRLNAFGFNIFERQFLKPFAEYRHKNTKLEILILLEPGKIIDRRKIGVVAYRRKISRALYGLILLGLVEWRRRNGVRLTLKGDRMRQAILQAYDDFCLEYTRVYDGNTMRLRAQLHLVFFGSWY